MKRTNRPILRLAVLCLACAFRGILFAEDANPLYAPKKMGDPTVYFVLANDFPSERQTETDILLRAVRQISIRKLVRVKLVVSARSNNDSGALSRTFLEFDENGLELYDFLKIGETKKTGNSRQALVRYTGKPKFKVSAITFNDKLVPGAAGEGKIPAWVKKPPIGKGFYAAVGMSNADSSVVSCENADTAAIGALLPLFAKSSDNGSAQVWQAELRGVYIARRWFDAKSRSWYSLAVLPR